MSGHMYDEKITCDNMYVDYELFIRSCTFNLFELHLMSWHAEFVIICTLI